MGRLTVDIPEGMHHDLRVMAANRGVTIKEYVLERITPELNSVKYGEPSLKELAAAWEERRGDFRLERGNRRLRDVIHDGHKW